MALLQMAHKLGGGLFVKSWVMLSRLVLCSVCCFYKSSKPDPVVPSQQISATVLFDNIESDDSYNDIFQITLPRAKYSLTLIYT